MSDEVTISVWAFFAVIGGFLFLRQSNMEKRIAIVENDAKNMNREIKEDMASLKSDMKESFAALHTRLDTFFASEISLLKQHMFNEKR